MLLGTKLQRIRKRRRETLSDVSSGTGLSASFISNIENGRANPSLDTLSRFAVYYSITINELLEQSQFSNNQSASHNTRPGFVEFIEQVGDAVDDEFRDILIRLDNKAQVPAQSKDDWMRYYYLLSPIVG